ncbi:hypothetical protein EB796_009199 [Bugula neritina]|uniref:Uncharacterized protein n=1 Tax=Bugula neritina TaxID=10212 RepID=A0A7J7K1I2_BUGNE|nr:hypothetical protein EB796_009199 [Bugula neritina]
MNMSLFTLLKLCVLLNLVSQSDTLRVGSWSFTSFGTPTAANDEAMTTIIQVMRQYDVIFMQGIKDASQDVLHELENRLNTSNQLWNYTVSDRLGSAANKIQFAYYYRMENLTLLDSYQYDDTNNTFDWEPFGALFHSSETGAISPRYPVEVTIMEPPVENRDTTTKSGGIKAWVSKGNFPGCCCGSSQDDIIEVDGAPQKILFILLYI